MEFESHFLNITDLVGLSHPRNTMTAGMAGALIPLADSAILFPIFVRCSYARGRINSQDNGKVRKVAFTEILEEAVRMASCG